MIHYSIGGVSFELSRALDFSWLKDLGKVFRVFDQTGSGCIAFGVEKEGRKTFVKAAGAGTPSAELTPQKSVEALRRAVPLYRKLTHPNLIRLLDHYPLGDLYVALFQWADGENLFDYWNFETYQTQKISSPWARFRALPPIKRLQTAEVLFSFLETTAERGCVAVDFYDGSILYDFDRDATTLCDIDFFRRSPTQNDMGEAYWGTKRLKAPEEYRLGAPIDERTNVFTLGALLFSFFGTFTKEEIARRYERNAFTPCAFERWELDHRRYGAALRAVQPDRSRRFATLREFHRAWSGAAS